MRPANISRQRIAGEVKNMAKEKLTYLQAAPLPDDLYTWHYTIQGPENTEFHEGIYHGVILLPFEYPFKPPDIVFLNKNGRFQTGTKICLTITQYHPEQWNSAWTIRTMLEAVISLFAENMQGVGALTSSSQNRIALAKSSHNYVCEKCGPIRELLAPRSPHVQPPKVQKAAEQIEMPRKMSEVDNTTTQIPTEVRKKYSEDLAYVPAQKLFKEQVQIPIIKEQAKKWSKPNNRIPIPERSIDEFQQEKPSNKPQTIYIQDRNLQAESLLGLSKVARRIQLNTIQLNQVIGSMRWVDN